MGAEERRGLVLVGLAVLSFSTTPVLIAWADPMSPFLKTWGRLVIAACAVGFTAWLQQRRSPYAVDGSIQKSVPGPPSLRRNLRFLVYGLIAALHFFFYIASLNYTTPAHSLAIVYTAPIFVTLLSALLLKEPIRGRQWIGVGIAVAGVAIMAGLEPELSLPMVFGDALALLSAITFGFYSVAGRYERERYPLLVYASRVYGAAALWLVLPALLVLPDTPALAWGWGPIAAVVALGLGPLALGHTLYNAALRRTHATYVNIIASQEVTGGIILSWLLLSQVPSVTSLIGALITLIGVTWVLR